MRATRGGLIPGVRRGLVGRKTELLIIESCLDRLRAGGPGHDAVFVEIVGEPGIGKSHLVGELAQLAAERGLVVASGRATEFERGVPFGTVVEALDDHLAALETDDREQLCGGWSGLLAEVFPALHSLWPEGGTGVLATERYRLHRAVRGLLESLAKPSGLAVLLDDVHWADPASVELLVHLVRHPPRAPVLIGLSYRLNRAPAALGAALADPVARAQVQRLGLGPLSVQAAAELLGRPVTQCRVLHERSGGNPLYLQLLAAGGARAWNRSEPGGIGDPDAAVPTNLGAALVAELDSLSPVTRLVAQAAAVIGDPLEPQLVAPTAGMDAAETLDALDELVARDLLRPAGGGVRLQFRHPLVRHLAYTSAGAGWRASAHARAAAVLEQRNALLALRARVVAPPPLGPTTTPPGAGLTAREREVAGLVTRGYSNRQIAEELMLSVRTVTTHVSHIFAKLGIASRGGLAAALERTKQTS